MIKIYRFISKYRKYTVYLSLILYWLVLFGLTSLPSKSLPKMTFSDKISHFSAYAVLAFLLYFAISFNKRVKFSLIKVLIIAVSIIAIYGAIDEIHQYFVPGRFAEWYDWLADILGGILGASAAYYLTLKGEKSTEPLKN